MVDGFHLIVKILVVDQTHHSVRGEIIRLEFGNLLQFEKCLFQFA